MAKKWTIEQYKAIANTAVKELQKHYNELEEQIKEDYIESPRYTAVKKQKEVTRILFKKTGLEESYPNRCSSVLRSYDDLMSNIRYQEIPHLNYPKNSEIYTEIVLWTTARPNLEVTQLLEEYVNYKVENWKSSIDKDS